MISQEELIVFLKNNPALSVSTLAVEAGVPASTLRAAVSGSRQLNEKHLKSLYPILKKYGLVETPQNCKIIAIVNHKGGTGKTTSAMNLGAGLAKLGKKVLLVDIDPQFNLTQHCGIREPESSILQTFVDNDPLPIVEINENLSLVPSELSLTRAETKLAASVTSYMKLKNVLQEVQKDFHYILIDCPPSLSFFTTNAIIAANSVIVALETEFLAKQGLDAILDFIDEIRQNGLNDRVSLLGVLLTKVNNTVMSRNVSEYVRKMLPKNTFKATIRDNIALSEASAVGVNIHEYNSKSHGAEDYLTLSKEIIQYG